MLGVEARGSVLGDRARDTHLSPPFQRSLAPYQSGSDYECKVKSKQNPMRNISAWLTRVDQRFSLQFPGKVSGVSKLITQGLD